LRAKLRGEVCQSDYEQGNAEFSREIAETEKEIRIINETNADRETFLRFCELAIVDIPGVWRKQTTISTQGRKATCECLKYAPACRSDDIKMVQEIVHRMARYMIDQG
jgi:hypothetical protein